MLKFAAAIVAATLFATTASAVFLTEVTVKKCEGTDYVAGFGDFKKVGEDTISLTKWGTSNWTLLITADQIFVHNGMFGIKFDASEEIEESNTFITVTSEGAIVILSAIESNSDDKAFIQTIDEYGTEYTFLECSEP